MLKDVCKFFVSIAEYFPPKNSFLWNKLMCVCGWYASTFLPFLIYSKRRQVLLVVVVVVIVVAIVYNYFDNNHEIHRDSTFWYRLIGADLHHECNIYFTWMANRYHSYFLSSSLVLRYFLFFFFFPASTHQCFHILTILMVRIFAAIELYGNKWEHV